MLDNPNTRFSTVYYYDSRGRMIQSIANNNIDGFDKEYINYSFTGKPVWRQMVHTSFYTYATGTITETCTYAYDHADRLTTTQYKLGADPEFALSTLTYDNQGRIASKKQGNATVTTSYAYNIRNWLTDNSGDFFTEKIYYNESYAGNTPQYNGNVSAVSWKYLVSSSMQGYACTCDGFNRLKKGQYLLGTTPDNTFTEVVELYDKNGNIKRLSRYARISGPPNMASAMVDDLYLTHRGNQPTYIADVIPPATSGIGFVMPGGPNNTDPILYNTNGAMRQNYYNGIAGIQYNVLNLPAKIRFMNGHSIEYRYDAAGRKHTAVYKTVRSNVTIPLGTTDYTPASSDVVNYFVTSYSSDGHIVYDGYGSSLKQIRNPEGYAVKQSNGAYNYFYYAKDHSGNNRATYGIYLSTYSCSSPQQEVNYYPFGMPYSLVYAPADGFSPELQPYKFGGKEYDEMHGLNWYDFEARYYNGIVPAFMTPDPMCEMYYSISPYAYCGNNPVNFVDLRGDSITYVSNNVGNIQSTMNLQNTHLGGYYNVAVDESGVVSMTAVEGKDLSNMSPEQKAYADVLNNAVNGRGMATINITRDDNDVLIGNLSTATFDIGDMLKLPTGSFVPINSGSAMIHEISEQYRIQALGANPTLAHFQATGAENMMFNATINPIRETVDIKPKAGSMTVTSSKGTAIVHYVNNNIVSVSYFK